MSAPAGASAPPPNAPSSMAKPSSPRFSPIPNPAATCAATTAWTAGRPIRKPANAPFSFWRTTYTAAPNNEAAIAAEKLSAEEILQRLVEEDEDHTENTRYILAVMLERQKLLRETDSQRTPSGILRVYEHRKTGEVFIVKDPDIPLSEVEAVQNEVFILLENNGRTPAPVEPESAGDGSRNEPAGETEAAGEAEIPRNRGRRTAQNACVTGCWRRCCPTAADQA